jgi:hypothetical protein
MQQLPYYLDLWKRYKKSAILLGCGLIAGVIITSVMQYFSYDRPPLPPVQGAGPPPAGSMRIAGNTPLPPPQESPRAPEPAAAPTWVDVPAPHGVQSAPAGNPFAAAPQSAGDPVAGAPPSHAVPVPAPQQSAGYLPFGTMEYAQSSNGYSVAVGRRAVDSFVPGGGVMPAVVEGSNTYIDPTPGGGSTQIIDPTPGLQNMQVGRNGLLANPSVDPSSTFGRAYNRGTPQ